MTVRVENDESLVQNDDSLIENDDALAENDETLVDTDDSLVENDDSLVENGVDPRYMSSCAFKHTVTSIRYKVTDMHRKKCGNCWV